MVYRLRQTMEFLAFRTGDKTIDSRAINALAKAQGGEIKSECYQNPLTGCGYSVFLKDDEFILRSWNLEVVVEYRGEFYKPKEDGEKL